MMCALALCLWTTAGAAASSYPPVTGNPANALAGKPIDEYHYDHARHCYKQPARGALALVKWLQHNSRGEFWGIMRCERLSGRDFSLHSEGRAVDWHLDVHKAADRRAASRLIRLLLATDSAGNPHALARRMGIQEIIWNCRSWWSGGERMDRYSPCFNRRGNRVRIDDTSAHRDHVHIGLSKLGARERTSFWRGR
jgi:hypothetical protein